MDDYLRKMPESKSVGDWVALSADRLEERMLSVSDRKNRWLQNEPVCGERSMTVNALLR